MSQIAGIGAGSWVLSDTSGGISTFAVALLWLNGNLQVWHVFIVTTLVAAGNAFQWPAYSAVTSLLVPKEQLGRVNGLIQMGEALLFLVSPILAGPYSGQSGWEA